MNIYTIIIIIIIISIVDSDPISCWIGECVLDGCDNHSGVRVLVMFVFLKERKRIRDLQEAALLDGEMVQKRREEKKKMRSRLGG